MRSITDLGSSPYKNKKVVLCLKFKNEIIEQKMEEMTNRINKLKEDEKDLKENNKTILQKFNGKLNLSN